MQIYLVTMVPEEILNKCQQYITRAGLWLIRNKITYHCQCLTVRKVKVSTRDVLIFQICVDA
jgi:hypothetical protein